MTQTVARLLAESLEAHDVDQVYCVPGESYVGLTSALIEKNSIRVVVCRHEGGAGFMAVADGRLRDRAGVAIVSRGPGLSNAMVALHSAYHDATPVVMLVGQVERKDFGRLALQEQNYSRLLVGRDQGGHRGGRAGAGLGGDRPRLSSRRKRHSRAGRGDPARGPLRRRDRRRHRPGAAACRRRTRGPTTSTGWR